MSDDRDGDRDEGDRSGEGSWVDRHLGKIVALVLALCGVGLVVRALTG